MKEKKTNFKKDLFKGVVCKASNRKTAGITLIALIITIIILLILAGVVINMTIGNDGIILKAQTSVDKYKNEQEKENLTLSEFETEMDKYLESKLFAEDISFTPKDPNWNVKNVKEALDYLYNN